MVFVCFSVMLRVWHTVCLRGYTLCHSLWVNFDSIFTIFSEGTALSDALESAHFHRQVASLFS